ncbi:hypothetical protein M3675_04920 [Brevibacillus invocatus]|nr:hypothetical protein [Brevibacillus invocatus]MCM3428848.1 hypothetical protein [Brevibacillus invocatus]
MLRCSPSWRSRGGRRNAGSSRHSGSEGGNGLRHHCDPISFTKGKFFSARGHHVLFFSFYAKIVGGEISINDSDHEITEVMWADPRTVKELMPALYKSLKLDKDARSSLAFYANEGKQ